MTDKKFIKLIKETIVDYFNSHVDKTAHKTITDFVVRGGKYEDNN